MGVILAASGCFLLGVITTLHPCPLTTNIAALSMLSGWSVRFRRTIYPFVLFIAGYISVYIVLSVLLGAGIFIRSSVSYYLQNIISTFLGPVLILIGMIFNDMIKLNWLYKKRHFSSLPSGRRGGLYALPMGALLALSFCPATAALFFGLLIPLAVQHEQIILFPLLYGLGASLPLIILVILVQKGKRKFLSEKWQIKFPLITGWILIAAGIFISLQRIYFV